MFRTARTILCLSALLVGFQKASAFSLLGPVNEAYQVNQIGYNFREILGRRKTLVKSTAGISRFSITHLTRIFWIILGPTAFGR
jgi:hypothetical protein